MKDYKYAITNGQRFIEITPNTPLSNVAYFCDVHLSNSYNGNGAYSLNFYHKDNGGGYPLGEWFLTSGCIRYSWINASIEYSLTDKFGNETYDIEAKIIKFNMGTGFYITYLLNQLIPNAKTIISKFPSAEIYNAYRDFMFIMEYQYRMFDNIKNDFLQETLKQTAVDNYIKDSYKIFSEYKEYYDKIIKLLKSSHDERSKIFLNEIYSKAHDFILRTINNK